MMIANAEAFARDITLTQRLFPLLAAIVVTAMTVELIRRRRLREEFAMLWIFASGVLLIFAIIPQMLLWISDLIGVYYITMMVVMVFAFLSMVIIHLSVAASRSADDTRKTAQRLAILEEKLNDRQQATGNRQQERQTTKETTNDK